VLNFYKIYQSSRYVGQQMVIRLTHRLTGEAIERLHEHFPDVIKSGRFVQGVALRQERNEPELAHLPRLIFTPSRRSFGRLRQLINAINASEVDSAVPPPAVPGANV
jgi:hypothetical protein